MAVGIGLQHLLEILINLSTVIQLAPEKGSRQEFFFSRERSPHIAFFESSLNGSGIVARRNNVPEGWFFCLAFHNCVYGR